MTQRQERIVNGIARKEPYKAIAIELGLSISTIGNHAFQLAERLGCKPKDLPGEVEYRSWGA